ncbi:hypothetical protein HS088_TW20G00116 [Tripterygium wilfordii]|uniref:Membrane insertase YidC/Oxa/ALB C-terminal domain-containing protein n=1 Tax=Tripterygium wilfordii TaxID=458696 RepID=A0A7J7C6L7_TRIWF|nr:mitochondrial inner membrane protein OXA1 [Tripterygium wilfordii]XP_038688283.1 mitochondrial inner membrane protein OXA1 [Tripterygium wilfordii]XP_038688284.1 mitochondrial inner membrane protein OXA1 [Tripterygium wilfordii]KAF5729752.1 hypothetical protein HS088_TW20G00116 [Tripterygium wilfordii]
MAAFMRSLSSRTTLVTRRVSPSFSCILHDKDDKRGKSIDEGPPQRRISDFLQQRSFGSSFNNSAAGFGPFFRDNRSSHYSGLPSAGLSFYRFMSSTGSEASDQIGLMSDVADVFTDATVQAVATQAPAVSEVAIAAADSFLPIAALQYLIDAVHSFTGFNWWASIALTTVLIRSATVPVLIHTLKSTSKLTIIMPRLQEIQEEIQKKGMDPVAVAEGQKEMNKLFKEHGVTPFTSLKGIFVQGPVFLCFFLAISNMVEKVPSFKTGGAYWFMDLTTPDSLYIFPVLTGLSFLITLQCNMHEGMEGNPIAGTMKKFLKVFALLSVPMTASFPTGIFFYWITSNMFSLVYGTALKAPGVKKYLGIPEIPKPPPGSKPPLSLLEMYQKMKEQASATQASATQATASQETFSPLLPAESSKATNQRISSSSVLSQRLKTLEKQSKWKNKNKKGYKPLSSSLGK